MTVTVTFAAWLGLARAAVRRVPVWLAGTRSLASSAAKPGEPFAAGNHRHHPACLRSAGKKAA